MSKCKKITALFVAALMLLSFAPMCAAAEQEPQIKNVIFMIGDGMGPNHLEWAKAATGESLVMDTMPVQGYRITNSRSGVTDSAAGGTALACGLLAFNQNVGTLALGVGNTGAVIQTYTNLCEASQKIGMKTGVVTSDKNTGATPACYSAHVARRGDSEAISAQQLGCGLDLLWSAADGIITESSAEQAGWTYVDNISELYDLPENSKSLAQFTGKVCYDSGKPEDAPLSELTTLAIDQLDNENGFFLMVEGAHIDKYSHSNNSEGMIKSLMEFDKAIANALEFAEQDGHTMVVVTADHETGGIIYDKLLSKWRFTVTFHTGTDVPLRVYGDTGMLQNGETIENTAVARYIAEQIGVADQIPASEENPAFYKELLITILKTPYELVNLVVQLFVDD